MKHKYWYFIAIVIAVVLIIPLCLYLFLPQPRWLIGVGSPEMWLQFWGCYLGGIFTALVGVLTLYSTNKRHNIEMTIIHKREELNSLKHDLSECIKAIDLSPISAIAFYINNNKDDAPKRNISDEEYYKLFMRLDDICNQLLNQINSFGVLYHLESYIEDNSSKNNSHLLNQQKRKYEFCCYFDDVVNDLTNRITELQAQLCKLSGLTNQNKTVETTEHINSILETIKIIASRQTYNTNTIKQLQNYANAWIESLKEEINDLEQKIL